MPSVHHTPVLDIAVDAVSKLDGDAELRGLWAVVTKCKDSLRQGRRLENISWRLWYREMAHQHPCDSHMSPFASRVPAALPPLSSCSSAEDSDDSDLWTSDDDGDSASDHDKPTVSVVSRTTSTARSSHRIASVASASRSEPSPSATRPLTHDSQRSISAPCRTDSGSSDRRRVNVGLLISSLLPQRLDVDFERASLAAASSLTTRGAEIVLPTPATPAKPSHPAVVLVRPTPRASPPSTPIAPYDPSSSRLTLSPESAAQPLAPLSPPMPETIPTESKPVVVESRPSPPAQADCNSSVSSGARSQSKGKDTVRNPLPSKGATGKGVVAARRVAAIGRTGASSSSGRIARPALVRSNTGGNKSQRSASPHAPVVAAAKQTSPKDLRRVSVATASSSASKKRTASPKVLALLAQPQRRRGVEVITSSDFETTDEDDSSWASESEEAERQDNTAKREAALAAARQADMFAKLPERSYSNLNVHKKPGLLTHLFHPDPSILPQGHPYRATLSAQDLVRRSASTTGTSSAPPPGPRPQFRRAPSALGVSKSPVAGPVGSFVNAEGGAAIQGHATREAALAAARPPLLRQKTAPPVMPENGKGKAPAPAPAAKPSSGGYVSKGRPQDVEMESDSDDDPTDKIQLSRSVAQARLEALADPKRRAALAARQTQRLSDPLPVSEEVPASPSQDDEDDEVAYTPSVPIMLPHPYNLPPPMEPQTPRTIRLQMLSREMSESLRRNLLWERRVSKQAPRRQVGLIKPRMGSDGEEIPRDPGMYALPSQRNLVRMRSELQQPAGQKRMEQMQNERVTQMLRSHALLQPPPRQPGESEMEARSRIMRHRSFAGEYHAHGW